MRNTLPLLSRTPHPSGTKSHSPSPFMTPPASQPPIPTIRLTMATPSVHESPDVDRPQHMDLYPLPIVPKTTGKGEQPRKRLVPKKSKLGLLTGISRGKDKQSEREREQSKDFSDVLRRVGVNSRSSTTRSFDIYVDPTEDPDIGEIVVVKKKKSRAALGGVDWSEGKVGTVGRSQALTDVTNMSANVVASIEKEKSKTEKKPIGATLRIKSDEGQKWWSIGRGRKDSKDKREKEKEKEKIVEETMKRAEADSRQRAHSMDSGVVLQCKTAPVKFEKDSDIPCSATDASADSRQRAHSLDSSATLNYVTAPVNFEPHDVPELGYRPATVRSYSTGPISREGTPDSEVLLAPPDALNASNTGSLAVRAMRSVRSLARIGSWAQLRNTGLEGTPEGESIKGKKKKEKESKERKSKTIRGSTTSSFEIGALTPVKPGSTLRGHMEPDAVPGTSGTLRSISSGTPSSESCLPASGRSSLASNPAGWPVEVDYGWTTKRTSTSSYGSSLAAASSKRSSGASVRWDDQMSKTVKEKTEKPKKKSADKEKKKTSKETRRTSDGRKRPALASLFPDVLSIKSSASSGDEVQETPKAASQLPEVIIQAASPPSGIVPLPLLPAAEIDQASPVATPNKKARPRPMSEQLLRQGRPKAIVGDTDGVISILDAATTDLANLINRLDLEATPDGSPLRRTPRSLQSVPRDVEEDTLDFLGKNNSLQDSPLKMLQSQRTSSTSLSSLRPYSFAGGAEFRAAAQAAGVSASTKTQAELINQNIMPWQLLNAPLEDVLDQLKITNTSADESFVRASPVKRFTHKRTMSPPAPDYIDAQPAFQPLKAPRRSPVFDRVIASPKEGTPNAASNSSQIVSSSQTFGVAPVRVADFTHASEGSFGGAADFSPSMLNKRARRGHKKASSQLSCGKSSLRPETRRVLGMTGTMGSCGDKSLQLDPDDPDSDIPEELQAILSQSDNGSNHSDDDDTLSYRGSPKSSPQRLQEAFVVAPSVAPLNVKKTSSQAPQLPVFRALLIDDADNEADIEATSESSEDDTKKSFDFTGELQKLNESGASDRRSFVEQVESAFKTPAKMALKGFSHRLGLGSGFLSKPPGPPPPLPPLPVDKTRLSHDPSSVEDQEFYTANMQEEDSTPSLSIVSSAEAGPLNDIQRDSHSQAQSPASIGSKTSDGQLRKDFRFGGRPPTSPQSPAQSSTGSEEVSAPAMSLSDIMPPPAHNFSSSSIIEEDSSLLKSIFEKVEPVFVPREMPPLPEAARSRLNSDSSEKRQAREEAMAKLVAHSRESSACSFSGLSSFNEVRRGFEFGDDRPAFYPPSQPNTSRNNSHGRNESVFSIASVSSYGAVIHSGSLDPFDYGMRIRPASMDMSVDDTFSFLRHDPRLGGRQRVDSDASSFYFTAPSHSMAPSQSMAQRRHHSHNDSVFSVTSGPPISLYNRSMLGHSHRRSDSSTSASSIAHAYGRFGASGGRAAWARHQRDGSVDSVASGFSALRLGRPGIGEKMFDSSLGAPLSAISASPTQSAVGDGDLNHCSSIESMVDTDKRSSVQDSLFEESGQRSSVSSESVFGVDEHRPRMLATGEMLQHQLRPVSMFSLESNHGPKGDNDTMVSMLGGGHVRRQSIISTFNPSPLIGVAKRTRMNLSKRQQEPVQSSEDEQELIPMESDRPQLKEKQSVASARFGKERMELARKGLLNRLSLEESCLSGEGEDTSLSYTTLLRRNDVAFDTRRSSYESASSGADTPPLSVSDNTSQSSGSQSSIDMNQLSALLTNATHPVTYPSRPNNTTRARARGHGHRRRVSQIPASRASAYETIQEEVLLNGSAPSSPAKNVQVQVAGGDELRKSQVVSGAYASPELELEPQVEIVSWDDRDHENGMVLRRWFAFRNEAHETLEESKRVWEDTPFSVFAVQTFDPPRQPAGMQALLEHSQKTYGPLPSDMRPTRRRSRTLSRPSPYPRARKVSQTSPGVGVESGVTQSPQAKVDESSYLANFTFGGSASVGFVPLQDICSSPSVNINTKSNANTKVKSKSNANGKSELDTMLSPPPKLDPVKVFSPLLVDFKDREHQREVLNENAALGLPLPDLNLNLNLNGDLNGDLNGKTRQRVASGARRSALGWSKRSAGKSAVENKENLGMGGVVSPTASNLNQSLRISRPRPKGRPTPAAGRRGVGVGGAVAGVAVRV